MRKMRNVVRHLIGVLNDFDPESHCVSKAQMGPVDAFMLDATITLADEVTAAYEDFNTTRVIRVLEHFISVRMSSFYIETTRDRLYTSAQDSTERRAVQTVMYQSLGGMCACGGRVS